MKVPPLDSEAFLDFPALAPPPGVTPQFDNPPSLRAPGLAVLQLTVATLFVGMRFHTKHFVVKKVLPEDWWLLASWICFACFHILVFLMEDLPLGVHQWNVTMRDAIRQGRLLQISTAIYCCIALPLKVAIILQIRRIVLPCQRTHSISWHLYRWTIDFFLMLNILFYLTLFVFVFLACRPFRKSWDVRVMEGYCVPHRLAVHVVSASINTVSDCMTVLLPQPVIWGLNIGKRRKVGLSAVFAVGGLACIASAIRLYYAVRLFHSTDLTFSYGIMGKWIEPELTLGFMAACLPVFPAFIKSLARTAWGQKLRFWTSTSRGKTLPGGNACRGKNSAGEIETVGSKEIRKKVEMDIEFAELTTGSEERVEGVGERRDGGGGGGEKMFRYEEWHDEGAVQGPQQACARR